MASPGRSRDSKSQASPKGESDTAVAKVPSAIAKTNTATESSYVQSIESAAIRQILQSFPVTEEMARNVSNTNWNESLFVSQKVNNQTMVTVPKNIEDFRESTMMMSILKIFEIKGWIPSLSGKELPKSVIETKEGAFFAGFVSGAIRKNTGKLEQGTSKYSRGIRAFQTYCVERKYGKARHLRLGGLDSLNKRLSEMKGFTTQWWGLRSTITALFKSLEPVEVSDLETYVRSKEELLKTIKTRLACENGGCFRPEELRYLQERYIQAKETLNVFLARISRPDKELAEHFDELYAPVKTKVEAADNEIKANLASRARILFPNDNKKKSQQWAKKTLAEKLYDLSEDKLSEFMPETLPGIRALPVAIEGTPQEKQNAIQRRYAPNRDDESAMEVIVSWYSGFDSSIEEA